MNQFRHPAIALLVYFLLVNKTLEIPARKSSLISKAIVALGSRRNPLAVNCRQMVCCHCFLPLCPQLHLMPLERKVQ
jgi:hypothetical protein